MLTWCTDVLYLPNCVFAYSVDGHLKKELVLWVTCGCLNSGMLGGQRVLPQIWSALFNFESMVVCSCE